MVYRSTTLTSVSRTSANLFFTIQVASIMSSSAGNNPPGIPPVPFLNTLHL